MEACKFKTAGASVAYGKTGDPRQLDMRKSVAFSQNEAMKKQHYKRVVQATRVREVPKSKPFVARTQYDDSYYNPSEQASPSRVMSTSINAGEKRRRGDEGGTSLNIIVYPLSWVLFVGAAVGVCVVAHDSTPL